MRLCVFAGSSTGSAPVYAAAAERLGALLGERGIGLVYGGGDVGLMGVLARTVVSFGGEVIGVIPDWMIARERASPRITEQHVVATMAERKALMAELADAFLAIPGGLGTLDELFEVWTWSQLGIHDKAVGLLDVAGYHDQLLAHLDRMVAEGFVEPRWRDALYVDDDVERLLSRLGVARAA